MNLEEFLKELEEIKDKFHWNRDIGGRIRGYLKEAKCGCCSQCFCPLTAVARIKFSLAFPETSWTTAYLKLGMEKDLATSIVIAADNLQNKNAEVRSKLLKITPGELNEHD